MKDAEIKGRYSGLYFGAHYFNHVYEPNEETTKYLLEEFKHRWRTGDYVSYREKHKATEFGEIEKVAYSTERNGGATIKVYKINNGWIEESTI